VLTFYQYLAFLIPFVFVIAKGYFLSIEFSLYPYFVSSGLLPYKDIVDQHFPSVFFGTFSLPFALVDSPVKLLFFLLGLNFLTTFFLLITLKRLKVAKFQLWTLIFSLLLIFFSANTLWIETFVCLLLSVVFYLNTTRRPLNSVISGIVISQIILLRPTIIFFAIGYFLLLQREKIYNLLGLIIGVFFSFWYLLNNNILDSFFEVAVIFNKTVYTFVQSPTPTARQLLSLCLLVTIFVVFVIGKKKPLFALLGLSTLVLVFPRFGLEHLQVFGLVAVYTLAQLKPGKVIRSVVLATALLLSVQPWLSIFKVQYGNYFYTPDILEISNQIKQIPDKNIYLYGASDLIYQLAQKLPPNNYYLPSLPWYLNYQPFQDRLKHSLAKTQTIIVDPEFTVDGQKLINTTPELYSYIKMNYYLERKIRHLEIYKIKP